MAVWVCWRGCGCQCVPVRCHRRPVPTGGCQSGASGCATGSVTENLKCMSRRTLGGVPCPPQLFQHASAIHAWSKANIAVVTAAHKNKLEKPSQVRQFKQVLDHRGAMKKVGCIQSAQDSSTGASALVLHYLSICSNLPATTETATNHCAQNAVANQWI